MKLISTITLTLLMAASLPLLAATDKHLGKKEAENGTVEETIEKVAPTKLLSDAFIEKNKRLSNDDFWGEEPKHLPPKKAVLGRDFHNYYEDLSKGRNRVTTSTVNKKITLSDDDSTVAYHLKKEEFVDYKNIPVKSFLYDSKENMVTLDIMTIESLSVYFANTFFQKFNSIELQELSLEKSPKPVKSTDKNAEDSPKDEIKISTESEDLPFLEIDYCISYKEQSLFMRFITGTQDKKLESFTVVLTGKC